MAAASYIFNARVPGYHCRTLVRPAEQKNVSGLSDGGLNSALLADGDFPLMLYEDFARTSQHQLRQRPQHVHMRHEKEGMDFVWQSGTTTSSRGWGAEGMEACALKSLGL